MALELRFEFPHVLVHGPVRGAHAVAVVDEFVGTRLLGDFRPVSRLQFHIVRGLGHHGFDGRDLYPVHVLDVLAQSRGAVVAVRMGAVERRDMGRPVDPVHLCADRIGHGIGHQGLALGPFPVEVLADTCRVDHHRLLLVIDKGRHDAGVEPLGGHRGDARVTVHQPRVRRPLHAHAYILRAIILRRAAAKGHDVQVVRAERNAALEQHRSHLE